MTLNTFLKFTGPRTYTAYLLVCCCCQLSIIPFATNLALLWSTWKQSLCQDFSAPRLDSGMLHSDVTDRDHVPRNESNPSEGEIIWRSNKPFLKVRTFVFLGNTHHDHLTEYNWHYTITLLTGNKALLIAITNNLTRCINSLCIMIMIINICSFTTLTQTQR